MISRRRGTTSLEEADRPGFEGLGHQRVIGVGQGAAGQVPRFVPAEQGLVEQDPHQLGDGHGGVGVVELDGDLVGEGFPVVAAAAEPRHDVGQRTRDQKILLDKPQVAAAGRGIVRIEDARQHLGGDLLVDGVEEIAAAELQEIEILVSGGAPEPKRVDGLPAIADDRPIDREFRARIVGTFGVTVSRPSRIWKSQLSRTPRSRPAERPPTGRDGISQLSGCSTCRPSLISWRNMPYS